VSRWNAADPAHLTDVRTAFLRALASVRPSGERRSVAGLLREAVAAGGWELAVIRFKLLAWNLEDHRRSDRVPPLWLIDAIDATLRWWAATKAADAAGELDVHLRAVNAAVVSGSMTRAEADDRRARLRPAEAGAIALPIGTDLYPSPPLLTRPDGRIRRRRPGRPWPECAAAFKALALYQVAGRGLTATAAAVGRSPATVHEALHLWAPVLGLRLRP